MDTLAKQHASSIELRQWLATRGPLGTADLANLLSKIAAQVVACHDTGRLHGSITLDSVHVAGSGEVRLAPPTLPASGLLRIARELCPPELRDRAPLTVVTDLEAAQALISRADTKFDARRIDVFQLAVLAVTIATGASVDEYLSRPRLAEKLSPHLRRALDRAIGISPSHRLITCHDFLEELSQALEKLSQAASGEPSLKSETPSHGISQVSGDTDSADLPPRSSANGVDNLPFQTLGQYEIVGWLGSGGMGDVYKGYDAALDRYVAIKVLPAELARHDDFVVRFRAEAAAVARVEHPNIVPIYTIGSCAGHHFFAMQFVAGQSLAQRLSGEPRLPLSVVISIVRQVLAGLAAAHQHGLVHRDIKPGNILLNQTGDRAMLADFGLVKSVKQATQMTATGVIMGSVDYISPEQGRGKPVDGRSDLYSIGVLMYQMLAGRLPFIADSPTAMIFQHAYEPPPPLEIAAPSVPAALAAIVHRLLAKSPSERYQTCEELLEDLAAFHRRTAVIHAPQFGSEPAITEVSPPRWWANLYDQVMLWLWQKSPALARRLQNTQQQVDVAVLEYEQRYETLARLVGEAEEVLNFLERQLPANKVHDAGEQATLLAEIALQREELDSMRLARARASARLAQLRAQRDALHARLKLAKAQYDLAAGRRPKVSLRWRVVVILVGTTAALLVAMLIDNAILSAKRKYDPYAESALPTADNPGPSGEYWAAVDAKVDNSSRTATLPVRINVLQTCTYPGGAGNIEVVGGAEDGSLLIFRSYSGKPDRRRLFAHQKSITALAWNERTQHLASASRDGEIVVWDWRRRGIFRRLSHHQSINLPFGGLAFSLDGSQLLTVGSSETCCWDVSAGTELQRYPFGGSGRPNCIAWLPDSSGFIIAGKVVNLDGNRRLAVQDAQPFTTHPAVFAGGHKAMGIIQGQDAIVWNLADGSKQFTFGEQPACAALRPLSQRVVFGSDYGKLSLWDLDSGNKIQDLGVMDGPIQSVAVSGSGDIAMAVSGYKLRVVKLPDDKPPSLRGSMRVTTRLQSIAYSPHEFAAIAAGPEEVHHVDVRNDAIMHGSMASAGPVSSVAYMPDGIGYVTTRPSANRDGLGELTLRRDLRGPYTPRYAERRYRGHAGGTMAAAIVQNGTRIVSGGNDNHVRIWNTATEKEIASFDVGMPVRFLVATGDGNLAAIAGDRLEATVWNLEEQKQEGALSGHSLAIRAMSLAKDVSQVATASGDRTARVWDLTTCAGVAVFEHPSAVSAIDITSDGKWIVTGSVDGSLRLWDVENRRAGPVIWAHEGPVDVVKLSPDARTMLSSGHDQQLRSWNVPAR